MSPGRIRSWEEPEEAEALDDDWIGELPLEDTELEDQFGSLEAAETYAVTEFKNASSDVKNATRTFMEARDLVLSGKAGKSLLPCGRCGCFRWCSSDNAKRITTDWRWERHRHWHEQPGRKRTWSWIRKGKAPRDSRRPSPAKSRVTSTGPAKGGPAHRTRAHLQPGQCLLCRQMGQMVRDCPNRGMRDDPGINLKRAFDSFVGMTGEVSSLFFTRLVITTTQQQEVERVSGFTKSHVPVAVWLSLLFILERIFSTGYLGPRNQRQNTVVLLGCRRNQSQLQLISYTAPNSTHSADHRERYAIEKDLSLLTSLQHLYSLNENSIIPTLQSMPITFGRSLCRVGSLRGG